jgi:hypothetical protein
MPSSLTSPLGTLVADLQRVFGPRLLSVVAYGRVQADGLQPSLALVSSLTQDDLDRCAALVGAWHTSGASTPLLLPRDEFAQSLDSFPVEFGEIIAEHKAVYGDDPFAGLVVAHTDLRRAAEVLARSLLLHVRENYLEAEGRTAGVEDLVTAAAPGFAALLRLLARLDGAPHGTIAELDAFASTRLHLDARLAGDLLHLAEPSGSGIDAARLFPGLLASLETVTLHVDRWRAA